MNEMISAKKQDFLDRLNEWREKNSDCLISSEEIDTIFSRDKEDLVTDIPNIFENDD